MKIKLSTAKIWEVAKGYTFGSYYYCWGKDNNNNYCQELLETTYYLGYLRLTIYHQNKFIGQHNSTY